MKSVLSFVKDIPVLFRTYISPQILSDIYQLVVVKGKKLTKSFPVEVHVTEHCNLNCGGCNHFSCLAEEEYLEPQQFEKDIKRLSELTKDFFNIKILGGEPLLHPRVTDFFDIARKYFPYTPIQITTNGLLLTKQPEDFWINCRKNKITISISQYPVKLDRKEIKKSGKKHKVKIVYTGSTAENRMCKIPLDLSGSQDMKKSFQKCAISWGCCVTLRDSRIYTCCFAAHIKFFNRYFKQNLAITDDDYIDIYKVTNKDEIINFLEKPFPFCRYCKTSQTKFAQSWGISKKEITEWINL
ncbi:MAG: radical SAM protein [Treponema sp.]|jgi:organic radical activating enzyme|nr:radical SAM protein [Treponema sp.]